MQMKHNEIAHAFEINIRHIKKPLPTVAVVQSMNTLMPGDVLKVRTYGQHAMNTLRTFCSEAAYTLLLQDKVNNEVTLFIRKDTEK